MRYATILGIILVEQNPGDSWKSPRHGTIRKDLTMHPEFTQKDAARFWAKVGRTDVSDDCWLWTANCMPHGYGLFRMPKQQLMAHRAAWEFATGEELTHADVIGHICDVPGCVRNDDIGIYVVNGIELPRVGHLFKGTHADNSRDAVQKGRMATGDRSGPRLHRDSYVHSARSHSHLSLDDVHTIRVRRASGEKGCTLACEYGISDSEVSMICSGKRWKE
jgi:hypothetical protein